MKEKSICLKCQHRIHSDVRQNGFSATVEKCECFADGFFKKVHEGKSDCSMYVSNKCVTVAEYASNQYSTVMK